MKGSHWGASDMNRQLLSFVVLVALASSVGCRNNILTRFLPGPQPAPNPVSGPVAVCSTSFFDNAVRAGFNPPIDLVGPAGSAGTPPGAQWFESGSTVAKIVLTARFVGDATLAELAGDEARVEQFQMLGNRIIRNEPVVLDSGQEAWIIESLNEALIFGGIPPTSTVIVLLVENQTLFDLRATGTSDESESLTAVGLTLCAGL